jgi:hypothetical protein
MAAAEIFGDRDVDFLPSATRSRSDGRSVKPFDAEI